MQLAQGISFLSQWEISGGGRAAEMEVIKDRWGCRWSRWRVGWVDRRRKVPPLCGTRGLGPIESSNDD